LDAATIVTLGPGGGHRNGRRSPVAPATVMPSPRIILNAQATMAGTQDFRRWAPWRAVDCVANTIELRNPDVYANVIYAVTDAYTLANVDVRRMPHADPTPSGCT
jgi:hypothetical protein